MLQVSDANGALQQRGSIIVAAVTLGVVGISTFLCLPVVVEALSSVVGLGDQQIARFSFVQLFCLSLGAFASLWLGVRIGMRKLAGGALIILATTDLLSAFVSSYVPFLILRAVAGFAGGLAVCVATAVLARTQHPDRNFGWFLFSQIAFQMIATWLLPKLVQVFGISGVFVSFVVLEAIVFSFMVRLIPDIRLGSRIAAQRGNTRLVWFLCTMVLGSIFTYAMAIGSFWTFVGRIGQQNVGLAAREVGAALSIAAFGGIAGAALAIVLGTRVGRVAPVLLAVASLLSGLMVMREATGITSYVISAALFSFGWYALNPYQLGVLAALDRDGRPTVASAVVAGAGFGIGPAVAAAFIPGRGLAVTYTVSLICVSVSATLVLSVIGASKVLAGAHGQHEPKCETSMMSGSNDQRR